MTKKKIKAKNTNEKQNTNRHPQSRKPGRLDRPKTENGKYMDNMSLETVQALQLPPPQPKGRPAKPSQIELSSAKINKYRNNLKCAANQLKRSRRRVSHNRSTEEVVIVRLAKLKQFSLILNKRWSPYHSGLCERVLEGALVLSSSVKSVYALFDIVIGHLTSFS